MQAIATLVEHDPYLKLPLSERIAAKRERRARIAARGLNVPPFVPADKTFRPDPIFHTPTAPVEPPPPGFKEPWFSIVCEYEPAAGAPRPRIDELIRIVSRRYNITRDDILSPRRTWNIVKPRQIIMYLAKTLTLKSLPEIGRRMDRDHTSVLHAVRKITLLLPTDATLAAEIAELIEVIQPKPEAI